MFLGIGLVLWEIAGPEDLDFWIGVAVMIASASG
jgi:hypothetical protein